MTAAPGQARWFFRVLVAFVRRDLLEAARYRAAFLTRFFGFLLAALSLYFFSRFVATSANAHLAPYGGDYLAFGLCGIIAAQLQQIGITTLAQRVRMAQLMGVLEAQLSTPAPAWIVLGAQPIYDLATSFARALLYVLGAALFLDVSLRPNWVTLALGVPLALLTFGGIGLLGAAATMVTRRSNPVGALLGGASALLSGVVYPVSVLPGWLARAGRWLPLTHGLEILRKGLLAGASPAEVSDSLLALVGFAAVSFGAGLVLFGWALRRARCDGSLSHF
jgi:ABC-2 type transport system permease protein